MSFLLLSAAAVLAAADDAAKYFTITIVDAQTGRGVPLVELRTVHGVAYYTDSNGIVAFHEPGLEGKDVFFHVTSHGYEFPQDGFGYRGKTLHITPGGQAKLTIQRINLAERLYRVTGAGIYRDSVLVGAKVPLQEPLLNSQVAGQDSVLNAIYRDKIYWVWGDTNRLGHPLGNFQVTGATSELPGRGGLDPALGIDLHYFAKPDGFVRPVAPMPGKGLTWITALVPLPERDGRERLYASYLKVEPPLTIYARGLAFFNDDKERFESAREVEMAAPAFPNGHAFRHRDDGIEYVYFAGPFPVTRVRAGGESFLAPDEYETYTCVLPGSTPKSPRLDRDEHGRLRYVWRKRAPALTPGEEAKLTTAGALKPDEARWRLRERDTGKSVLAHAGSVYWNAHRRRWVMIAVQSAGTSFLGEVWYAEADAPTGPWAYAVKVVTHQRYSFYNPKQHPMFDQEGGRFIFFEGTYSHTFSGNPEPTPRYDYNQVMYRLDLADPRTALPVAVYPGPAGSFETGAARGREAAFFAPDRPLPGTLPVIAHDGNLRLGQQGEAGAVFHALPAIAKPPAEIAAPLYEYRQRDGKRRTYSVEPDLLGYERAEQPLCLVWRAR